MLKKQHFSSTIRKNPLWKNMLYIAIGLACCSMNEDILSIFPFWTKIYWKSLPENIYTIPYDILISLTTILFLGLAFHKINKFPYYTYSLFPQIQSPYSIRYNMPLYLLLTIYFLTTIILQSFDIHDITTHPETKNILHSIHIGVIIFISYSVLITFPPVYACGIYALTILFIMTIFGGTLYLNLPYVFSTKSIIPFFALPFLILGRPKVNIIHTKLLKKTLQIKDISLKKHMLFYIILFVLSLFSMFQLSFNTKLMLPTQSIPILNDSTIQHFFIYTLSIHFAGTLIVIYFIKWKEYALILLLMIIFALINIGTISKIIFIESNIPIFIIQFALALAGSLCISLLSTLVYSKKNIYTVLAITIFFINSIGYLLGYILWNISLFIEHYTTITTHMYIPILGITAVISILLLQSIPYKIIEISKLCYLLNLTHRYLIEYSYLNKLERLTPREKEILSLVQQGLKNIEISNRLQITESTLRVHLRNTYRKLNIHGRQTLKTLPYEHSMNAEIYINNP